MAIRVKQATEAVLEAYDKDASIADIARRFSIGRSTVYRILWAAYGKPLRRKAGTETKAQALINLASAGLWDEYENALCQATDEVVDEVAAGMAIASHAP